MKKIHFETIDSTNAWAMRNIDDLPDRTLILADKQTAGRGRFQREWVSQSSENLYMSIVLKPAETKHMANLTQYMSLVLTKVFDGYGVNSEIKWPNDIHINNKKIVGILCESSVKGSTVKGFVLGIGVNLNMSGQEIENISTPAASLNLELNKEIDKNDFLEILLKEFFANYDTFLEKGFPFIAKDYINKTNFLNKKILISENGTKNEYFTKKINEDGSLLVVDSLGKEKIFYSADINLI